MKEDEKNTDKGGAPPDSWRSVSDDGERRREEWTHSNKEETDEETKARVEKEQKRLDEEKAAKEKEELENLRIKNRLACRMFPSTSNREV